MILRMHSARLALYPALAPICLGLLSAVAPQTSIAQNNTRDLADIRKEGVLKILVPMDLGETIYLPRSGSPVDAQRQRAEQFAKSIGVKTKLVPVYEFRKMIPMLLSGRGDLIAANLTVTPERQKQIAFTVPFTHVYEQIITASNLVIRDASELQGKKVVADPATSFWANLQALKKKYPAIELIRAPPGLTDEDIIDRVARGVYDATVRDSNIANMYLAYRDDIRTNVSISGERDIAWGVQPNAPQLLAAINQFLHKEHLTQPSIQNSTEDWPAITKRKVLRVLLRNNNYSYYLWRGELMGFEYEMLKHFADLHKLRLEVIIPPSRDSLLSWLRAGRGDIAAGFLNPDISPKEDGILFTRPYHYAPQVLVSRDTDPIKELAQLNHRRIVIPPDSIYTKTIEKLQNDGLQIQTEAAPDNMDTEELIAAVGKGTYPLTLAEEHLVKLTMESNPGIKIAFPVTQDQPHAWAVRGNNRELLKQLNQYIKKEYKGLFYNITYNKYFNKPVRKLAHKPAQKKKSKQLSPFDPLVKQLAQEYDFDWRLLTSQMYQESRFNPRARSEAGAQGLMQVLPITATQMGFDDLRKPEVGLHAGIKYLHWLRERFEMDIPVLDRIWFALAAYNAGLGHVLDARRLAEQQGLDPNRWFNQVEKAMQLLSKPKYADKARHGYVNSSEVIRYVQSIRDRYHAYLQLTRDRVAAN